MRAVPRYAHSRRCRGTDALRVDKPGSLPTLQLPDLFVKFLSQESRAQVPDGEAMENGFQDPDIPRKAPALKKPGTPPLRAFWWHSQVR